MDEDKNQLQMNQELKDNFDGIAGIAEDLMKIEL